MRRILYVTDLDGTLLNTHDRINQESLAIINDLVKRGMLFTYATARSLVSASVVTQGLLMDIPKGLFLCRRRRKCFMDCNGRKCS